jgi:hypothetical protein
VRRHGGDVVFVRVVDGYSTTRMLATARAATRAESRDGRNYPGPR